MEINMFRMLLANPTPFQATAEPARDSHLPPDSFRERWAGHLIARPHPDLLPQGKEQAPGAVWFSSDYSGDTAAGFFRRPDFSIERRTIHPLQEERAGVRTIPSTSFSSFPSVRFLSFFLFARPALAGQFMLLFLGALKRHTLTSGTILPQIVKTKKPPGVFLYAFFEEKCILDVFLVRAKPLQLQPARNQHVALRPKMRPLYDRDEFQLDSVFSILLHNMLWINGLEQTSAFCKTAQILVTYNNKPCGKAKKTRF